VVVAVVVSWAPRLRLVVVAVVDLVVKVKC
jgi:hypothetical protein